MIIAYYFSIINALQGIQNYYCITKNNYKDYLQGNRENVPFLKQFTRWTLIISCLKFCLLGFAAIANATEML